jgi:DNA-binding MarR family transcriptional regulator
VTGTESGRFNDLPPSAKYVYDTLDRDGPLTRKELQERTGLPERTIDDALETLENCGFIVKTRDTGDLRQVVAETATARTYNPWQD